MTEQKLYDLKGAAKVVGFSVATLKEEINKGTLRAKRRKNKAGQPTGSYRITPQALDDWIAHEMGDA